MRRPGRWVAAALVAVAVVWLVHSLITNPGFQWGTVGEYMLSAEILKGVLMTVELTALTMLVGIVLGVVLAVMRLSANPLVSWASALLRLVLPRHAGARAADLLVQPGLLYPVLKLGIPFGGRPWPRATRTS